MGRVPERGGLSNSRYLYKSAFKHGLSEADIEWAFLHTIRNGLLEDYEDKYLLIGFDTRGNPIEVMYNRIDEERLNVFHAMKCRKAFLER